MKPSRHEHEICVAQLLILLSRSGCIFSNLILINVCAQELVKFAVFIVRKFTEVAQKNGKVYMELLFWKTMRDAYEIEEGYGSYLEK